MSKEFKISPENAPKIYNHCDSVGHVAATCPQTVDGLELLINVEKNERIVERDTTTALSYPWGMYSDYVVVDPVTKKQKKKAKKPLKRNSRKIIGKKQD